MDSIWIVHGLYFNWLAGPLNGEGHVFREPSAPFKAPGRIYKFVGPNTLCECRLYGSDSSQRPRHQRLVQVLPIRDAGITINM